jgi:hypothetical protein
MELDVGCGDNPRGDVKVDIYTYWNPQIRDQGQPYYVNVKYIPNFIKASAKHLPFRNDVFETVTAFEVIEHLDNPFLAIKEMLRVCNSKIVLLVQIRFLASLKCLHI